MGVFAACLLVVGGVSALVWRAAGRPEDTVGAMLIGLQSCSALLLAWLAGLAMLLVVARWVTGSWRAVRSSGDDQEAGPLGP